jgi:hypothetical protein
VVLSAGAPDGGAVISLSSSHPAVASVPATTTAPANSFTASFTIATGTVSASTVVTITATYNGTTRSANLTINPPGSSAGTLTNFVVSPTTVTGGSSAQGAVVLAAAATTATSVALSSSNAGVAAVPTSVTVPAGSQSAVFAIATQRRADHLEPHRDQCDDRQQRFGVIHRRHAGDLVGRRRS